MSTVASWDRGPLARSKDESSIAPGRRGACAPTDARAKLIVCLALVLLTVSTPPEQHRLLAGYAALLLLLAVLGRLRARDLGRRLLHLAPFLLLAAAAPLLRHGDGLRIAIGEVAKAALGCGALVLLAASTPADELLAALASLRCPRLIVLLLGLTARYLHLLREEAARLRRAAAARGFAPNRLWQARTIGSLVGALFLRSHARAERVHAAMLARGFTGDLAIAPHPPWRWSDSAFLVLVLAPALAWRLW